MVGRSAGTRAEPHASEASQAPMPRSDNAPPEKSRPVVDPVRLRSTLPTSRCVPKRHQKELKSSTAEKVFFFVSAVASQGKPRKESSSQSPKELVKFVRSGWKILENV